MPWEVIFTALGSSSLTAVIIVVLGLTLFQKIIEQGTASAGQRLESSLKRAEEAYSKAVEMSTQIDINLREKRIQVYATIWQATSILPRWPRSTNVTYPDIYQFSERLRSWYFTDQGGMWLSVGARQAYGDLQDTIWETLPNHIEGVITKEDYDAIQAKCSMLRSELTNDLLSRRAAPSNPQ